AVALDPTSAEITKALVMLAFSLNQTDEAVKYALKAIELDPDDYQILRRLGIHMAQERKIPQAIELLNETDPASFSFEDSRVAWKEYAVNVAQLAQSRESFATGYGSCSFKEPTDDLKALGLL
ncbi:MAG: tetratricopeptide repeat protein, partial [Phycisphaerales bacterium]